ncbi:hypothetical protein M885DRAFT_515001 [Pelagophyceae sp. CCMP2097]|nr:hypothetical protein M885DRAFT_515001 [Pelagophyceae sp. CCMP2097]
MGIQDVNGFLFVVVLGVVVISSTVIFSNEATPAMRGSAAAARSARAHKHHANPSPEPSASPTPRPSASPMALPTSPPSLAPTPKPSSSPTRSAHRRSKSAKAAGFSHWRLGFSLLIMGAFCAVAGLHALHPDVPIVEIMLVPIRRATGGYADL